MRDLHEMHIGQRVMVTVVIVVVVLLLLAIIGYLSGRWEAEAAPTIVPSPHEARLTALDREAIDNAYRSKIEQLFSVWLKDDTGQPARGITGANQARKAYDGAIAEIERREKLLLPQPTGR